MAPLERQFAGPVSTVEERFGDLIKNFVAANPHPHALITCKAYARDWAADLFPNEAGVLNFELKVRREYWREAYRRRRARILEHKAHVYQQRKIQ